MTDKAPTPFDILNSITKTKKSVLHDEYGNLVHEKAYAPVIINRGLSQFPDTILYANEMNRLSCLTREMQHSYLINSIRPHNRRAKWAKKDAEEADVVMVVREYFQCNEKVARQYMKVLTDEQITIIKEKMQRGGNDNGKGSR